MCPKHQATSHDSMIFCIRFEWRDQTFLIMFLRIFVLVFFQNKPCLICLLFLRSLDCGRQEHFTSLSVSSQKTVTSGICKQVIKHRKHKHTHCFTLVYYLNTAFVLLWHVIVMTRVRIVYNCKQLLQFNLKLKILKTDIMLR